MSLVKKILSSSLLLLIGNSIGRLSMFLTNIIATHFLSQEVFGQFMMIRSTISMIEGIVSGSLSSPMIKRIAEVSHRNKDLNIVITTIFFVNISIILLLSIMLYIFTPTIIETYFLGKTNLINALYIAIFLLAGAILSSLIQSILIGLEEYKKIALSGLISSSLSFPLIVFLIYNFGLYGTIFGVTSYFLTDFFIKYIQLKRVYAIKIFQLNIEQFLNESKNLLHSSKYLLFATILTSISFWYARVIIINETNSFGNIAIFDAAFQWLSIIMIITGATTSVALPMMSKAISVNKQDEKKVFYINLFVNLFISIFIAIFFIIFAKNIMSLYGKNYIQGQDTLVILSITAIFFTLSSLYNKWMVSQQKTKSIFLSSLLSVITLFIVLKFSSFPPTITLALSFTTFYFTNFFVLFILVVKNNNTELNK